MTIEFRKLLNTKTTAEKLNVTEGAMAKWRVAGEGPRFIRVGRRICYDPNDVAAWLDTRRVSSTSQVSK